MKNLILILAVVTMFVSCSQSSKSSSLNPTVYCMYTKDNGTNIYRGCAEGQEALQQKTIELRDQGYTVITNTEKSDCSECQ